MSAKTSSHSGLTELLRRQIDAHRTLLHSPRRGTMKVISVCLAGILIPFDGRGDCDPCQVGAQRKSASAGEQIASKNLRLLGVPLPLRLSFYLIYCPHSTPASHFVFLRSCNSSSGTRIPFLASAFRTMTRKVSPVSADLILRLFLVTGGIAI